MFSKSLNGKSQLIKTIALVIHGKPVNLDVEICDGLKDGYIKLCLKTGKNC